MDFLLHFGPSHYNDLFRCDHPYFSKDAEGSAKEFVAAYQANYAKTDGKGLICIPSGNHDMDRLAKNLDTDELKVAFAFLLSMPGAPFIYYGDEIGMRYVEGLTSVEGGYGRTGSRTPMQWDDSLSAGFSAARKDKYYIALDESADRPNAKTQSEQEDSLRSEVKRLIAFRKANPALQSKGEISFVSDEYPLVYKRTSAEQEITVIINPGADAVTVPNVNGKVLYTVGGSAVVEKGIVKADGCTAVFVG